MNNLTQNESNIEKLGKWRGLSFILILFGFSMIFFGSLINLFAPYFFTDTHSAFAQKINNSILQLGTMLFTPFAIGMFINRSKPFAYLELRRGFRGGDVLFVVLFTILSMPLINLIASWNESLHLPAFLSDIEVWMRKMEALLEQTTDFLLSGTEISVLVANLITIAVIPSLCEEFLFRGLLLRWAQHTLGRSWVAVVLTAFIFSMIHLQFLGFFFRFLLGIYLGFLVIRTSSLWIAVLAHFLLNAMTVVAAFLYNRNILTVDYRTFGSLDNQPVLTLSVVLLLGVTLYYARNRKQGTAGRKNVLG